MPASPRATAPLRPANTRAAIKIAVLLAVAGLPTRSIAADDSQLCRGSSDAGIAACNRAIASGQYKGRNLGFIYLNRGQTYYDRSDYDRAAADFARAIRLDPNYTAAYTGRGLIYERKGNIEQARRDYNAALAVPQKYDDGKWAHDTARRHLDELASK